jgi:hypothetical protein
MSSLKRPSGDGPETLLERRHLPAANGALLAASEIAAPGGGLFPAVAGSIGYSPGSPIPVNAVTEMEVKDGACALNASAAVRTPVWYNRPRTCFSCSVAMTGTGAGLPW